MDKKILIVEDNKAFNKLLAHKIHHDLAIDSVQVYSYKSAKDILEYNKEDFFLAILDLHLPDAMEGEVVDYCLSIGVPSIVLTANYDDDTRDKILEKKVIDYVFKRNKEDIDYLISVIARVKKNKSIKALVVDDSSVYRGVIIEILKNQLFETVFEAKDGIEAIKILEENPDIKVVVADYSMPKMDGFELVGAIRKGYQKDKLAVIIISSHDNIAMVSKFLKFGANDFIKKPFSKEELICRLNLNLDYLDLIQETKSFASVDILTGLYNRKYFFEYFRKVFNEAKNNNQSLSVVHIDLDHFKDINERFGYPIGDRALVEYAGIIKNVLPQAELIARSADDEFLALFRDFDPSLLAFMLDDLSSSIYEHKIVHTNQALSCSASIGVCNVMKSSPSEMLETANRMLNIAKQDGRNTTVFYDIDGNDE